MRKLISLLFALLLLPAYASAQTSPDSAATFIAGLSDQAVEVLRDDSMSLADRESALAEIVSESFDVRLIGRFVLGKAWDGASEDERNEYLDLFSAYVLQNYTQRLGGYSGQTLQVDSSRAHKERDAVVRTTILQDAGDPIGVDWLVRDTENGMRILDVVIGGKSLTLAQKKEFQSVVAREKLSGLLHLLRLKVSKYSAQS